LTHGTLAEGHRKESKSKQKKAGRHRSADPQIQNDYFKRDRSKAV
jgi:hypothetical protein